MKESIGYTVTLNIIIIFIVIVFAFLGASLIYFKSNKVSNVITSAIEKYEGYNSLAIAEIDRRISSLGYSSKTKACEPVIKDKEAKDKDGVAQCTLEELSKNKSYCVYYCSDKDGEYYYYKIGTNMMLNIPIINDIVPITIFSNTNRLYNFEENFKEKEES